MPAYDKATKKKKREDRKAMKQRKACRESHPSKETCKNCANADVCSIEATHGWIHSESKEVEE